MELFFEVMAWVGIAVTAATGIVVALEPVAKRTPTDKDDAFISKAKAVLAFVQQVVSSVSVKKPVNK